MKSLALIVSILLLLAMSSMSFITLSPVHADNTSSNINNLEDATYYNGSTVNFNGKVDAKGIIINNNRYIFIAPNAKPFLLIYTATSSWTLNSLVANISTTPSNCLDFYFPEQMNWTLFPNSVIWTCGKASTIWKYNFTSNIVANQSFGGSTSDTNYMNVVYDQSNGLFYITAATPTAFTVYSSTFSNLFVKGGWTRIINPSAVEFRECYFKGSMYFQNQSANDFTGDVWRLNYPANTLTLVLSHNDTTTDNFPCLTYIRADNSFMDAVLIFNNSSSKYRVYQTRTGNSGQWTCVAQFSQASWESSSYETHFAAMPLGTNETVISYTGDGSGGFVKVFNAKTYASLGGINSGVYSHDTDNFILVDGNKLIFGGEAYESQTPQIKILRPINGLIVGASTDSLLLEYVYSRKNFYASGLNWIFYDNGSAWGYESSTDGITWSNFLTFSTGVGSHGAYLSFCSYGTYIYYAGYNGTIGSKLYYRRGVLNSNGNVTWTTSENTITFAGVSIQSVSGITANGAGNVYVAYTGTTGTYYYPYLAKNTWTNGSWHTASGFPIQLNSTNCDASGYWRESCIYLSGLGSDDIYTLYGGFNGFSNIYGKLWNGTTLGAQQICTQYTWDASGDDYGFSATTNGTEIYLLYNPSTNFHSLDFQRRNAGGSWLSTDVSVTNKTSITGTISIYGNILYTFYWGIQPTNFIHEQTSTNDGSTWNLVNDPLLNETIDHGVGNFLINSIQKAGSNGVISLLYETGSSAPYCVKTYSVTVSSNVTVSASATTIDVGQSFSFSSSVSSGNPPYSYQWVLNGSSVSGATSSSWTYTPSSSGFHRVYLNVTDKVCTVESNVIYILVNPSLSSVTISPTFATLEVNQAQTFTSSVSGGTKPYSYQWIKNGTQVSGQTSSTYTFSSSTTGTFLIKVNVTDNVGIRVTSNAVTVEVSGVLTISISPSGSIYLDVGQSESFTSSVSGGFSPYTYQWYLNGGSVYGATGSSWTYTPTSAGSKTVYCIVKDNATPTKDSAQSNTVSVMVNSPPVITFIPTSSTIHLGQNQTYTSAVYNGTSPFSYQWYQNGGSVSGATSGTWTFVPSSTGSYIIKVKVTDAAGWVSYSGNGTLTVLPSSSFNATIVPTSTIIDISQSISFSSTVKGGTPPYNYTWYINGNAIGGNTTTLTWTPTSPGSYSVWLNVTGSSESGTIKSNICYIVVNAKPYASISPTSATMDAGQSKLFTATYGNGTSPYTFQWYLDGSAMSGATGTSWTYVGSYGNHTIYVIIKDAVLVTGQSNYALVTVNYAILVSISPTSPVELDVGQSQLFTSSVSGGTGSHTYQWCLNGTAVSGATGSSWTYTPSSAGYFPIYLNVTDSLGARAESNTVYATVSVHISVMIIPSSASIFEGSWKVFTANVSYGTPTYTFQWYRNGSAVSGATGGTWNFTLTSVIAEYIIHVKAVDSLNEMAISSNVTVLIIVPPLSVTITASVMIVAVGVPITFTCTITGGSAPYLYAWYLNNTYVGTTSTYVFNGSIAGIENVYLNVTSNGITATSNVITVTVIGSTIGPPFFTVAVVAVVVCAVAGVGYWFYRKIKNM